MFLYYINTYFPALFFQYVVVTVHFTHYSWTAGQMTELLLLFYVTLFIQVLLAGQGLHSLESLHQIPPGEHRD